MVTMVSKIVAKSWEFVNKKKLESKLRLYGSYKELYKWDEYKRIKEHVNFYQAYGYKVNTQWYKYFTLIRQEENPEYLPEDIWHICLEPVLNQRSFAKALNDKNLFHRSEYKHLFPKAYVHVVDGICYAPDFSHMNFEQALNLIKIGKSVVIKKALDSGGGKGVLFFESKKSIPGLGELIKMIGKNFVIQEKVQQHEWFSRFNPTSVNTIRVVTYRSIVDEQIHVIQTLLRVGKPGSYVDNQSSGGIACGISSEGKLNDWGCDKLSVKFNSINGISLSEVGIIPDFQLLKNICIEIAATRVHERVLVFDTWRDADNNIRLLEINNINIGIEDLQKNNGPLFGDYIKEVLEFCSKNRRTYCFDFEL